MAFEDPRLDEAYPVLSAFSAPLRAPERAIVGRDGEIEQLMAAMMRPELSNSILIAAPGTGKTMLVQGAMLKDTGRLYLEADLAAMVAAGTNTEAMAGAVKEFFDEAETFSRAEQRELVMFIDEFHQIVQMSPAAVEAIKPVLAASGTRGLRIIAATTHEEFNAYIAANLPLVERLQQIRLESPDSAQTVTILRGMARRYEVESLFPDDRLFEKIVEYTNRYVTASTQPRKALRVLDAMIGWHRKFGRRMDAELLGDVLKESYGINLAFRLDPLSIRKKLDEKVYSQKLATSIVARRLQLCVADLHDKSKPISSFLFAGSTGVGKTEMVKQMAHLLFGDATNHLIRFDMSEYANDDTLNTFRHELTQRVSAQGYAVLLLDEVEKASGKVVRLLLQMLDDGRLTDEHGRQVSFLNTYIVLTTNAGSQIFKTIAQYNPDNDGSGRELLERMKEIRRALTNTQGDNRFPPELIGRIDALVPFQPLTRETQRQIAHRRLGQMRREVMAKHGVRVALDRRVLAYLIEDKTTTDSDEGGARQILALATDEVIAEVAAFVNAHPREKSIRVDIEGTLRSENKEMLKSDAHVVVSATR